ncbi:hypothetical protein BGW36DRAFT_372928 [Talaromyces proteolyticus]|uniref:Uncharacterized protein n=1 Tax=Talaromyces proteolyticus TaxID=1131652 RepID=A0AAD4KWI3_9EURO|nr:uncharacterized protein BGW36DRAFT_372928 [Talaromyces proteolyticus]KAH8702478.1 hypothetical protein BGW36DRAFT_372928 [Talaromyces proteolyticus]
MMDAVSTHDFEDWPDWPLRNSRCVSYISTTTQNSETSLLSDKTYIPPPSPATSTSPTVSDHLRSPRLMPDEVVRLKLRPSVTISFIRKSRLFRIQYGYIDIIKEANGTLKSLELGGQQHSFVHTFANTRLPVPHLEYPRLSDDTPLRVSFLDEQTVQTANTTFTTQLSYTFDNWDDCVRFQETLLASKLVFIAGIAEAKSKGRGEECISQNLRLLRGHHDRMVLLFFANSQRKDRKRYVSVPLNCIDRIDVPKKASRPISLHLRPNFELLAEMKVLQLQFLDDDERKEFGQIMTKFLD